MPTTSPAGTSARKRPSFGVSLWLCDTDGTRSSPARRCRSSEIQQTFEPSPIRHVPAIVTRTPYYDATWSRLDATRWELRFKNHTSHVPAILIRSVGPAGGPVTALNWDGETGRGEPSVDCGVTPSPDTVTLGDENEAGWMTAQARGDVLDGQVRLGICAADSAGSLGEGR